MKLQFDLIGRLEKISFASNAGRLDFAIYEAVYNSIHAIEDRFPANEVSSKGRIDIKIETDRNGPGLASVQIADNGVGLNRRNFESFCTCDSRGKAHRGGKGIGRFVWLTAFDLVQIESTYLDDQGSSILRTFNFKADVDSAIDDHNEKAGDPTQIGTTVKLLGQKKEFAVRRQKSKLANEIALHFFSFFMSGTMPKIILSYDGDNIDIQEVLSDLIDDAPPENISVPEIGDLSVRHI